MSDDTLFETHLPLPDRRQGKVRDVYRLPSRDGGPARLLVVATDRISAFDVVMPTPIPGKGRLLTEMSVRWFEWLRGESIVEDHLLSTDVAELESLSTGERAAIAGRAMICRAAAVVPIECVARGYLAGSGWTEYRERGTVCGVRLPQGLREGDRLPEPIFTPATKASVGHDENVDFETMAARVGPGLAERLRAITLQIYRGAAAFAERRGILLADTKFEFGHALDEHGHPTGRLLVIDEVLTPDSSRFWPLEDWRPGREQPSFDKQYLREWLLGLVREGRWGRTPPGPELPPGIVAQTLDRYREALRRLFPEPISDAARRTASEPASGTAPGAVPGRVAGSAADASRHSRPS